MQRKKPFSGKKKKEQLRARRARKTGGGEGHAKDNRKDEHHDGDEEHSSGEEEEESGEESGDHKESGSPPQKGSNVLTPDNITIPKEKYPRNKLVTVFEKETKEEVEARKKKGYLPLDMYTRNHVRTSFL
jgi:hypothetical protein